MSDQASEANGLRFSTAYAAALQELLSSGQEVPPIKSATSPHSGFGTSPTPTLELTDWSLRDVPATSQMLWNPERSPSRSKAFGMAVWQLTANRTKNAISYYNPDASDFSDDGATIRAPWGLRLLAPHSRSVTARALALLQRDPSSLRGVLPVFTEGDVGTESRDVPCLLGISLRLRGRALHATAMFRSLNPYSVWPYDHAFLALFATLLAGHLKADRAFVSYHVASLQIPVTQAAAASRAAATDLSCAPRDAESGPCVLRRDEDVDLIRDLPLLKEAELAMREGSGRLLLDNDRWWGRLLSEVASYVESDREGATC